MIERTERGNRQWLAQWNEHWKAFFFVGGHREGDESFRDCVLREIGEELELTVTEFALSPSALHVLNYRAVSRSADELTDYHLELFETQLSEPSLSKVSTNAKNKWIDEDEINR